MNDRVAVGFHVGDPDRVRRETKSGCEEPGQNKRRHTDHRQQTANDNTKDSWSTHSHTSCAGTSCCAQLVSKLRPLQLIGVLDMVLLHLVLLLVLVPCTRMQRSGSSRTSDFTRIDMAVLASSAHRLERRCCGNVRFRHLAQFPECRCQSTAYASAAAAAVAANCCLLWALFSFFPTFFLPFFVFSLAFYFFIFRFFFFCSFLHFFDFLKCFSFFILLKKKVSSFLILVFLSNIFIAGVSIRV